MATVPPSEQPSSAAAGSAPESTAQPATTQIANGPESVATKQSDHVGTAPAGPSAGQTTANAQGKSAAPADKGESEATDDIEKHTSKQPGNDLDTEGHEPPPKKHDGKGENSKPAAADSDEGKDDKPAGGYDATPIPDMQPGYTLRITIHRAENLPMADINALSSDPYVISQLYTTNPTRHKEDPPIQMRTFTIRREINPVWDAEWVLANVPASGFKLKCRIYDEDPADHDDRLGNAHINVSSINDNWQGFEEQRIKIKKRMGSKRAYAAQAIAKAIGQREHIDGYLTVSIENLGRTESKHGARIYTMAPAFYIKHYSPLLGRAMGQKTPGGEDKKKNDQESARPKSDEKAEKQKAKSQRYNFQANQMQLNGPVPAELYHRYVEFRPFIKRMFTGKGLRGFMMNKVLVHQHNQIYHYDRSTENEYLGDKPSKETTLKFLDLVHYDTGGRIFTYIITLDSLMRFTETGKEFGIQMLSKHSLHSAAAAYIAFSGEFLVRRLQKANEPPPEEGGDNAAHPPDHVDGGPPDNDPPKDPSKYELIIDNDSGTYRPNADLLPQLKQFLEHTLPGLHVVTLDCQKDADEQQRIKKEQLEKKKQEGRPMVYKRISRGSSISSSDESDLDDLVGAQDGSKSSRNEFLTAVKRDFTARGKQKQARYKNMAKGNKKKARGDGTAGPSKEAENVQTNGNAPPQASELKA